MVEINPDMVRRLRERTGAGLMECKRALDAAKGDEEAAIDILRKSGLKSAEKKASREMGEGRVTTWIAPKSRVGALVALTCETDFVAATDDFNGLLAEVVKRVADDNPASIDTLLASKDSRNGQQVGESIKLFIGKLGENTQVAKIQRYENMKGRVGTYVHHDKKKAALVSVTTDADEDKAQVFLKQLCQHIVSMVPSPLAIRREEIPAAEIEREKAIYLEEVKGKPAEMQEKIVKGKLDKFFADVVLPEQKWVFDDSKTVQKVLEESLGKGSTIAGFTNLRIGK
ncbi:MAG: translation elongation factor Ts [Planctomycetota bacterium]|nr:translation elongation factor Ts [Planctomycetota bacterium]